MPEEKRADTKRHFSDRREESLRWGGRHGKTGRSVSRIGVGSLEQQTECREAENPSDLRHFSTHFFFSTRGGSGDGGKEVLCRVGKL